MTREVYTDKEVIEFSQSQVFMRVFEDIDAEGERLARKFRIQGFPTIIVLDSDGQEVDRIIGARSADELIEELKDIFKSAKSEKFSI